MRAMPHDGIVTGILQTIDARAVASALDWLALAGVDTAVDSEPRDWLAMVPMAAIRSPSRPDIQPVPASATGPTAATLARAAAGVDALIAAVAAFDHPLRRPGIAPRLVEGDGTGQVLIVTDMPDADGTPAARLAERMLGAIGLASPGVRVARLVPWPTAGGRPVQPAEVAAFAPFVARLIAQTAPHAILALGQAAASLAGIPGGIAALRGRWLTVAATDIPLIATFHPRALITQPELKRIAWDDLQAFEKRIAA